MGLRVRFLPFLVAASLSACAASKGDVQASKSDVQTSPKIRDAHVSQYASSPRDPVNCGPASMTMVGRALGVIDPSGSDGATMEALANLGGTSLGIGGTTVKGLERMAHALNLRVAWRLGPDTAVVANEVHKGSKVILGGNAHALPWRRAPDLVDHYVVVAAVTTYGTFVIDDPLDRVATRHELSTEELVEFCLSSTGGGVTMVFDRAIEPTSCDGASRAPLGRGQDTEDSATCEQDVACLNDGACWMAVAELDRCVQATGDVTHCAQTGEFSERVRAIAARRRYRA